MGNSQSYTTDKANGRRNRLSKPPSSIPTKSAPSPKCRNLVDTTPYSYQSPWLGSTLDDSPAPQQPPSGRNASPQFTPNSFQPNESLGEEDFDITPKNDSPMTFATKADELRRRLSAPGTALKANRFSLNLASARKDMSDIETPLPNRRATIQDANELVSGLGLTFDAPIENNENKPYFRRNSLRIPGIATRVPEKSSLPEASPKEDDHICFCERLKSPGSSVLDVDFPTQNRRGLSPLRATTPNDFEYSYLGGLRPGSLHVVNGCASPTPSSLEPGSLYERSVCGGACDGFKNASLQTHLQRNRDLQSTPPHHEDAITNAETQVNPDPFTVEDYDIAYEEPTHCTYLDPVPETQTVPLVHVAASDPNGAPPTDRQTLEKSPHLLVTSKCTALEDELFEDEAVDILMPPRDGYPGEEAFSSYHKGCTSRAPKTSPSPGYGTHIQKRYSNKLSKSDSGYSSASSKEPSKQRCDHFSRDDDRYDISYGRGFSDIDDNTNSYMNSQPSGSSMPVDNTICERQSAEDIEADHILTEPYTPPGLGRAPSEYYSHENNSSAQQYYQNFESSITLEECPESQVEEYRWTTYQPKLWPLGNEQTTPDEQYSTSRQFFQLMPHLNKPDIMHVSCTALPGTPAGPRPSVPATPRRSNSTGTIANASEQTPSGKYLSRIKSLVALRGQQQSGRRAHNTSASTNHKQGQPQEQYTSNEKRRKSNKLRRKSLVF